MDPHVVFDCQKVLPNRFALALAAAARSRALGRGAEPRLDLDGVGAKELALHEIAAGVFDPDELVLFLPVGEGRSLLPPPAPGTVFRAGGSASAVGAPASPSTREVH